MFIRRCQCSQNMAQYPYGVCEKSIDDSKQSSILCDLCKFWIHTKCSQLKFFDFQHIKACTEPCFCFKCISDLFGFGTLNNQNFISFVLNNKNSNANTGNSINLEPPPILSLLFNQFNDLSSDSINKSPENMMTNCKYYNIDDMQKIKSNPNLSLNKDFDNLEYLIKTTNQTYDVIAISESRIKSNMDITTNINMPNYSIEYTLTQNHAAGTLLYISNNIAYKPRKVLNIYKTHEFESTFIEITTPKKTNITLGVVYQHLTMDLNKFNHNYVNKLLDNITRENKATFLLGDLNIKYESHASTNEFLDSLSSNMILPYILYQLE